MTSTTDHSILTVGSEDQPFKKEAEALTRVLAFWFVDLPHAFASAFRTQAICDNLYRLDVVQLASLGVDDQSSIPGFAARQSGLMDEGK